jgi:EPS-associated MarR family transcriptional regulator
VLTDETRYRILKLLEADPHASQRRIANELDISLGRVNFCLQALIEKGLIKVNNFRNSSNKRAYLYLLTPRGIEEKAIVTARFLKRKLDEYDALKRELEELQSEAGMPKEDAARPSSTGASPAIAPRRRR